MRQELRDIVFGCAIGGKAQLGDVLIRSDQLGPVLKRKRRYNDAAGTAEILNAVSERRHVLLLLTRRRVASGLDDKEAFGYPGSGLAVDFPSSTTLALKLFLSGYVADTECATKVGHHLTGDLLIRFPCYRVFGHDA